jgi:hypothetical protein
VRYRSRGDLPRSGGAGQVASNPSLRGRVSLYRSHGRWVRKRADATSIPRTIEHPFGIPPEPEPEPLRDPLIDSSTRQIERQP